MLTKEAINHFGSVAALASALGISRAAVYQWPETVPESSSWKLQALTGGALLAEAPQAGARTAAAATVGAES